MPSGRDLLRFFPFCSPCGPNEESEREIESETRDFLGNTMKITNISGTPESV